MTTTFEYNLKYIEDSIRYLVSETARAFRYWCSRRIRENEFVDAYKNGNVETVSRYLEQNDDSDLSKALLYVCENGDKIMVNLFIDNGANNLDEALNIACGKGNVDIAELLVKKGAKSLDEGLKTACQKNRYSTAELMVQKGANPRVGIRNATSQNILKMLYRNLQNTENKC